MNWLRTIAVSMWVLAFTAWVFTDTLSTYHAIELNGATETVWISKKLLETGGYNLLAAFKSVCVTVFALSIDKIPAPTTAKNINHILASFIFFYLGATVTFHNLGIPLI